MDQYAHVGNAQGPDDALESLVCDCFSHHSKYDDDCVIEFVQGLPLRRHTVREKVLSWLADLVDSDLRFEAQHDSELARFLVRRALQNPLMIGRFIFGLLVDYEEYLLHLLGDHLEQLEQHVLDEARLRVLSGVQNSCSSSASQGQEEQGDVQGQAEKEQDSHDGAEQEPEHQSIRVRTRRHSWWRRAMSLACVYLLTHHIFIVMS